MAQLAHSKAQGHAKAIMDYHDGGHGDAYVFKTAAGQRHYAAY